MTVKRILLTSAALSMTLLLGACGNANTADAEPTKEATLNVEADMSSFSGAEDTEAEYVFDEYSVDDMITDLEGGQTEIVLIASLTEESNADFINEVNETAGKDNQRVYLIDYDSLTEDDKQKLIDFYGSLLNTDESGNAVVEAPTLFAITEGNISYTLIGTNTEWVGEAISVVSEVFENAEG